MSRPIGPTKPPVPFPRLMCPSAAKHCCGVGRPCLQHSMCPCHWVPPPWSQQLPQCGLGSRLSHPWMEPHPQHGCSRVTGRSSSCSLEETPLRVPAAPPKQGDVRHNSPMSMGLVLGQGHVQQPLGGTGPTGQGWPPVLTALLMTGSVTRGRSRRRGAIDRIDRQQGRGGPWRGQGDVNGW